MSTKTSETTTPEPAGLQRPQTEPLPARLPLGRAQRWLAAGEDRTQPPLPVFFTQDVFKVINLHAASDMDNEVGGWLAGRWCSDPQNGTQFVVVEALLPAQQVRSGSTFLTFTHDSQVAMLSALEEQYEDKCIVGWYHTHPRMGIFLSGYDTWLHNHFFPQPWQIALVVEPHARQGGVFVRQAGELSPRNYRGFYELHTISAQSVVDWSNLKVHTTQPEQSAAPPAEELAEQSSGEASPTEVSPAVAAPPQEPQKPASPAQSQTEADP